MSKSGNTFSLTGKNSLCAARCFAKLSGFRAPPSLGSGRRRLVCRTGSNWKKSPKNMTIGIPPNGRCWSSLYCLRRLSTAASVRTPTWLISCSCALCPGASS
ncbi:uncharacterized protein PODANS_2_7950 [Podospora anserina S mat+]|uniref:Podospora anserina S mat+ genomic DNA chromosome 2, supercontig 2 n=1 Tax=Podospora anserina (strain S / ATCC MYA-4624 / DSM 980 / FGSC 10383) TaxID=515849 RepID=B2B6J1_PODAN|nr:uncharacterized protein PODANS_2_7950 [Podospora anserina S mat+]CAP73417.1 unnamed protein product [Podospora anserina S mat+]CDP25819.1 Putative protein of unknown function [Podospora anserina S mat+]